MPLPSTASESWTKVLEQLGGAYEGYSLKADPNDPSTLYAATWVTGDGAYEYTIERSKDKGATWTTIMPKREEPTFDIAVGAGDPSPLYMIETADESSVSRSLDGGTTWEAVDFAGLSGIVRQLLFDPRSPDTIYAVTMPAAGASNLGVSLSMDGGVSWTQPFDDVPTGSLTLVTNPVTRGALYASGRSGIYRWVPVTTTSAAPDTRVGTQWPVNANGQTYGSSALALTPEDEPDLILVTATNGKTGYISRLEVEAVNGSQVKNPEEALTWQAANEGKTQLLGCTRQTVSGSSASFSSSDAGLPSKPESPVVCGPAVASRVR